MRNERNTTSVKASLCMIAVSLPLAVLPFLLQVIVPFLSVSSQLCATADSPSLFTHHGPRFVPLPIPQHVAPSSVSA